MSPTDAQAIRNARKAMRLTQKEMGDLIGLSGAFIGEMERQEKQIEKRTLLAILYILSTKGAK